MADEYEEGRRQRMEENRKRLEALNLPLLSQALHNSSSSKITSPLPKRMKSSTIEEQVVEVRRSSRVANMSPLVYDEPHTSDAYPSTSTTCPSASTACPSASTTPTNSQSSNPTSSQPAHGESLSRTTRHPGRKSSHYWWVDVIAENEVITKRQMTVKDMTNFGENLRIVVDFDEFGSPIGEAAGLLAGVCGQMAKDCLLFPISFESWSKMPSSFFQNRWNAFFTANFFFKANDEKVKHYLTQSISKKWKEHRLKLWNKFYDPRLSRNENIRNVPQGINEEQWALFVDYRLKPSTKELCKRNQVIRSKQTIPHTTGAKSLARRRAELMDETRREVGRGELWKLTHKKKDGNYINEEAREIAEKIDDHMSQNLQNMCEISPTDAVGEVFGKEHPGRVRGLGMGVLPTVAFKHTTSRIGGLTTGSCGASTSSQPSQVMQQKLDAMESQIQALCAYIAMKEGGQMPHQLATLFPNHTSQVPDKESGPESPNDMRRSSDGSNNNAPNDHPSPRT